MNAIARVGPAVAPVGVGVADQHAAEPQSHFGGRRRLSRVAAAEDDVLHLVAAQALGALLAHHPGDGVGDVALAAAVGSDDGRHARSKDSSDRSEKDLKPLISRRSRRMNTPRRRNRRGRAGKRCYPARPDSATRVSGWNTERQQDRIAGLSPLRRERRPRGPGNGRQSNKAQLLGQGANSSHKRLWSIDLCPQFARTTLPARSFSRLAEHRQRDLRLRIDAEQLAPGLRRSRTALRRSGSESWP